MFGCKEIHGKGKENIGLFHQKGKVFEKLVIKHWNLLIFQWNKQSEN